MNKFEDFVKMAEESGILKKFNAALDMVLESDKVESLEEELKRLRADKLALEGQLNAMTKETDLMGILAEQSILDEEPVAEEYPEYLLDVDPDVQWTPPESSPLDKDVVAPTVKELATSILEDVVDMHTLQAVTDANEKMEEFYTMSDYRDTVRDAAYGLAFEEMLSILVTEEIPMSMKRKLVEVFCKV